MKNCSELYTPFLRKLAFSLIFEAKQHAEKDFLENEMYPSFDFVASREGYIVLDSYQPLFTMMIQYKTISNKYCAWKEGKPFVDSWVMDGRRNKPEDFLHEINEILSCLMKMNLGSSEDQRLYWVLNHILGNGSIHLLYRMIRRSDCINNNNRIVDEKDIFIENQKMIEDNNYFKKSRYDGEPLYGTVIYDQNGRWIYIE